MKCTNKFLLIFISFSVLCYSCDRYGIDLSEEQKKVVESYTFINWNNDEVSVLDFTGSVVVIDFWESWCGPCLSAFPGFQRAINEYPDDIVIIAATAGLREGRDEAIRFIENRDYDFIYVDGTELAAFLGINGIPYKIILDRDGKIMSTHTGSHGAEYEYELLLRKIR